ncbi:MAG: hypothetical protein K2X90_00795 [Candidatus Babeliaceae bacterium]|nr:hypothetical protein [Candidatus Babeliaceae bacterium]
MKKLVILLLLPTIYKISFAAIQKNPTPAERYYLATLELMPDTTMAQWLAS